MVIPVSNYAGGAGPLSEYERRIALGELVDGDDFQVDTIQELQRLYRELAELEESCQLDRYTASKKSQRVFAGVGGYGPMHKGVSDPLEVVAGEISDESILLCLDEFMERCVVHAIGSSTDYRKIGSAEKAEASPVELFESIVTVADAQKMSPRTSSRSQKKDDVDLCVDNELGFAKDRTISRLTEMNSREYLEQHEARLQEKACGEVHLNGVVVEA
ncbi:hypothetical protein B296_00014624 [Ensete ventricosum]|uniref:Uncharacterized protein n=1 Tax=Ensete ventricosum TaxID=4639 RepID=A0A427A9W6_ENSVE|nr:hypothetical protein B296_00014624 [Ensete ventricosum]